MTQSSSNSTLTDKQHKLIDRLMTLPGSGARNRTYTLDEIDQEWYNNDLWTSNALAAMMKKGVCSPVKYYLRHSDNSFHIRYHFGKVPYACDLNAIRHNREYYDFVDRCINKYDRMLRASKRPTTPKQKVMLKMMEKNFGRKTFTRRELNQLYWEAMRSQKGQQSKRVKTFAHQLQNLIAKGKLRQVSGDHHLYGSYELCDIQDQKTLRSIIYQSSLAELASYNKRQMAIPAFHWEFD